MIPLHARIRREIEAAILSGRMSPGARIPVEHELMARYGCSRMTVSKALDGLTVAGLIERRKGAGSFVARPRVHSMVLDIPDLAAEVARRGQTYRWRLDARTVRVAAENDPVAMEMARGGELLLVGGTHLADGVPLAAEQRLIALVAVPGARDADFIGISPGAWLLEHVPWTEAESRIAAVAADRAVATALDVPTDTACLSIERRTWRGGDPITYVRQTFVGTAYDLTARFGPATSSLVTAERR